MLLRPIVLDHSEIVVIPEKVRRVSRWKYHIERRGFVYRLQELDWPMDIKGPIYLHLVILEAPNVQNELCTNRNYFLLGSHFMYMLYLLVMY